MVYAVMIEFGFNTTEYGKTVLAACFCHRSRDRRCSGPDLCSFHDEDDDIPRGRRGRVRRAALVDAPLFPPLRRAAFRA